MPVLWVGHEADCYLLGNANNAEVSSVIDAGYQRLGMRVSNSGGELTSSPDWGAASEIWHRFNYQYRADQSPSGNILWAAKNAAGAIMVQIVSTGAYSAKCQVWDGAALVNVGAAFTTTRDKSRFDIHINAIAAGKIEIYYGAPGSQIKVVNESGDYSAAGGIVRIFHGVQSFVADVAHAIVQTTSTLSSTSENKPPTSNGADVGGTGNYTAVDETTYSDTDTVSFGAVAQRQSFKAAARTLTQNVVTGVTATCRAWYDVGGPSNLKPYLTIGGTRYYGTTFALDVVAKAYQYTWTLNPATGVAFTPAEANAATLEWGWEAA